MRGGHHLLLMSRLFFTSVPVAPSIQIVKQRLQQNPTLPQRTSMSIPQITTLLEFCFTNTYFLFQGKYYEQVQGAAMGSPISPLIANLFMEEFEIKALSTCPHPPSLWLRFVDDTFVITKAEHSQALLQHNTVHSGTHIIRLTPFLDTLVTIEPNSTFSTTVYRKPTHTDQYLHWESNHHITAKQSVYNTLAHRAKVVSSSQARLDQELQHNETALQACQFPKLGSKPTAPQIPQKQPRQQQQQPHEQQQQHQPGQQPHQKEHYPSGPFISGTSEKFKRLCKIKGIQAH